MFRVLGYFKDPSVSQGVFLLEGQGDLVSNQGVSRHISTLNGILLGVMILSPPTSQACCKGLGLYCPINATATI